MNSPKFSSKISSMKFMQKDTPSSFTKRKKLQESSTIQIELDWETSFHSKPLLKRKFGRRDDLESDITNQEMASVLGNHCQIKNDLRDQNEEKLCTKTAVDEEKTNSKKNRSFKNLKG